MPAEGPREPARYDIRDDRFRALIQPNALLQTLGDGYGWLEGPVWFADHQRLYVSDLPADRILAWSPGGGGVETFRTPAGFPNGKARDRQGRLLVCSHRDRCIYRIELDGSTTILADRFEGRRLNAPNDIVCASDGAVWFTDPVYGLQNVYEGGWAQSEQPAAVYRLEAQTGRLAIAADDLEGPNGLAFSPDESLLYVTETGDQYASEPRRCIRRYAVEDNRLVRGEDVHTVRPGYADGLRVDEAGRLWASAGDGVHCIDADGVLLGKILTPSPVQNLCFGGRGGAQLFLCASHTLMSLFVNTCSAVRL